MGLKLTYIKLNIHTMNRMMLKIITHLSSNNTKFLNGLNPSVSPKCGSLCPTLGPTGPRAVKMGIRNRGHFVMKSLDF